MLSHLLPLAYILLMTGTAAQAQYQIKSWTTDDGLPQNTVSSIVQTRDGYLWLATLDGLVRYDGVKFTVFNKNNSAGILSNRFTRIIEDESGDLWVGTEESGVTRYHAGTFQTYAVAGVGQGEPIWQMYLNGEGRLVALTEKGIVEWNGGAFAQSAPLAGENSDSQVFRSRTGTFYFIAGQILHRLKDNRLSEFVLPGGGQEAVKNPFFEDERGRIWIGTLDAGLLKLENDRLTAFTEKDGLPKGLIAPQTEDAAGNLWAASRFGAAFIRADGTVGRLTTRDGLSDDNAASIFQDREGGIWIGTLYRGLNRVNRNSVEFYSVANGLAAKVVNPIFEDAAGAIWLGGGGLTRFADDRFNRVIEREKYFRGDVTAIGEDRAGRVWFGHWNGAYYLQNGVFTDFTERFGQTPAIFDIHEDRRGAVWFASNMGLFHYKDDVVTHLTVADGLISDNAKVIYESADGTLWFGTYGGLSQFKNGEFQSFTTADGLASNQVRSLYEDTDGVLWIGSYDGGLTRLKDGKFTVFNSRNGLFSDGVFQVLEDRSGNLWMNSNRGVYRVSKQQLNDFADGRVNRIESIAYGKADGLLETEGNGGQQPAGIKARDGKLWFPTQNGVAVIDPEKINTNRYAPPVVIESVEVDNASVSTGETIVIEPGKNNLEINYTGLSFVKPELVSFRYKLGGLDDDWVEAGTRRAAYYSYLPPGEYTFQVIAANSDGVWNETGANLRVNVVPPFYRTWWFWMLSISLIGAAAFVFYRRRVSHLEREKAAQQAFSGQLIESQERERKRIAAELHDGLGQSLVIIKNRALASLDAPANHERLLAQMEEISEATSAAIGEVRGIAQNLHPYQIEFLGLTVALRTMIEKLDDALPISFRQEIDEISNQLSKKAEINLYRIVQEALNNAVKHSNAATVDVILKKNDRILDLLIEDDGEGFAPDEKIGRGGMGLTGIGERAKIINARYEIRSIHGKGTAIHLQIIMPVIMPETKNG